MSNHLAAANAWDLAKAMIAAVRSLSAADLKVVTALQAKLVAEKFDRNKNDTQSLLLN